jgi:hypothetical protein
MRLPKFVPFWSFWAEHVPASGGQKTESRILRPNQTAFKNMGRLFFYGK